MHRLTGSERFNGVPQWLRLRALEARRARKFKVKLLAGHPTRKELLAGKKERNGLPVSEFNVMCDEKCTSIAKACIQFFS